MNAYRWCGTAALAATLVATVVAADLKVDLRKEQVGRTPKTFEPMVGTWVVAEDAGEKMIMVDGRPWVASKDNPTKLLIESARKLYGTSNEGLMDTRSSSHTTPSPCSRASTSSRTARSR
jgi:hypothetical protein